MWWMWVVGWCCWWCGDGEMMLRRRRRRRDGARKTKKHMAMWGTTHIMYRLYQLYELYRLYRLYRYIAMENHHLFVNVLGTQNHLLSILWFNNLWHSQVSCWRVRWLKFKKLVVLVFLKQGILTLLSVIAIQISIHRWSSHYCTHGTRVAVSGFHLVLIINIRCFHK